MFFFFLKVERDEDILMWSRREFHVFVAGGNEKKGILMLEGC